MKLIFFLKITLLLSISSKSLGDVKVNDFIRDLKFTKSSSAAITSGSLMEPPFISDPGVVKDKSGYHLFMLNQYCDYNGNGTLDPGEGVFKQNLIEKCFHPHVKKFREGGSILYAHSNDDGKTWKIRPTPVLESSNNKTDWDEEKVETPFPIVIDDTLFLFYCATGNNPITGRLKARYSIGVASIDLKGQSIKNVLLDQNKPFVKNNKNPILEYNAIYSDYNNSLQEPSVVYKDGHFELFLTGLRVPSPMFDFGSNLNGIAFYKVILTSDFNVKTMEVSNFFEPLNPPATPESTYLPLNIPEVHFINDKYYAFYTFFGEGEFHENETIKVAGSSDGLNWSSQKTILSRGKDTREHDGWGVMAPTIVVEKDHLKMFYSGWGSVDNHKCDRTSQNAKWGKSVYNKSKCVYGSIGMAESNQILLFNN